RCRQGSDGSGNKFSPAVNRSVATGMQLVIHTGLVTRGSTAERRLPNRPRGSRTIASSRIGLADMPQIPFLIQFRQLAQTILQFLPSRHSFARGLLRPLRNVITRGLALLPTVADVQVRTMLGPSGLAMAARASASAVGFRQRSENSHLR